MNWVGFLAIYFVTWFVCLMGVLPFGVRRVEDPEPGHDAGAPEYPYMWWKVGAATGLAFLITGGIWVIGALGWVELRPL